jgi:hypothetical protein
MLRLSQTILICNEEKNQPLYLQVQEIVDKYTTINLFIYLISNQNLQLFYKLMC